MILKFLIRNLYYIHAGSSKQIIAALVKLAIAPAVTISITEKLSGWYFENQIYMTLVLFAIFIDWLLGSAVHIKNRDFSWKKNLTGVFAKTGYVIIGYILFEMIHQIVNDVEFIASYFKVLLQLIVILYPAGSAMGNLSVLTGGKFPPIGFMKKLDKFQEDVDLKNFKTKPDETDINNT